MAAHRDEERERRRRKALKNTVGDPTSPTDFEVAYLSVEVCNGYEEPGKISDNAATGMRRKLHQSAAYRVSADIAAEPSAADAGAEPALVERVSQRVCIVCGRGIAELAVRLARIHGRHSRGPPSTPDKVDA